MNFEFINDLMKILQKSNIFQYAFTGSKVLAFALLLFKVLESFTKDFEDKTPKIGNLMNIFGYGLIIMSSDWIIKTIEEIFVSVDKTMTTKESDLYLELINLVTTDLFLMFQECNDWWDYINVAFTSLESIIALVLALILGGLFKLADLSLTVSYLLQRIFIIELLKFLFPLAIALSTYTGTAKLFHTWLLRYIGMFILGIAYIGILNIMPLIQERLLEQFNTTEIVFYQVKGGLYSMGILITVIVVFTIKIKLFAVVTNYIMGMFQ